MIKNRRCLLNNCMIVLELPNPGSSSAASLRTTSMSSSLNLLVIRPIYLSLIKCQSLPDSFICSCIALYSGAGDNKYQHALPNAQICMTSSGVRSVLQYVTSSTTCFELYALLVITMISVRLESHVSSNYFTNPSISIPHPKLQAFPLSCMFHSGRPQTS